MAYFWKLIAFLSKVVAFFWNLIPFLSKVIACFWNLIPFLSKVIAFFWNLIAYFSKVIACFWKVTRFFWKVIACFSNFSFLKNVLPCCARQTYRHNNLYGCTAMQPCFYFPVLLWAYIEHRGFLLLCLFFTAVYARKNKLLTAEKKKPTSYA